jgi:peptidoglycan/LPS O-acetylase OafA/YrhL
LLLPFLIWICPPARLPFVLAALIASSPFIRLALTELYQNYYAAYFLLPARMDTLLFGVLAAWMVRQPMVLRRMADRRNALMVGCLVLFLGLAWLTYAKIDVIDPIMSYLGYSWIGAFYFSALLLIVSRSSPGKIPMLLRPLCWLGIGAYFLYLFHIPVSLIVRMAGLGWTTSQILSLVLLCPFSFLSWHLFESRFVSLGHHRLKYRTVSMTNASCASGAQVLVVPAPLQECGEL